MNKNNDTNINNILIIMILKIVLNFTPPAFFFPEHFQPHSLHIPLFSN